MPRFTLPLLCAAIAVAACSGGDRKDAAVTDSLGRDLQMPAADANAPLNDRGTAAATSGNGAVSTPRSTSTTTSASSGSGGRLAAGTTFTALTTRSISSATDKAGETFTARVGTSVKDASGRVVIPAGSLVTLRITALHESENKSDNTGTLALALQSVEINGQTYSMDGSARAHSVLVGRKTNVNDVAKVGAGAGIGAVAGRVLGGSKGTVIGGVLGGAVGAQRAVETKDRDVVVSSGSTVTITLGSQFVASR